MNLSLLAFLICPSCRYMLQIIRFESSPGATQRGARGGEQTGITSGVLKCECGKLYPIIDGVPRFLEGGLKHFPEFTRNYQEQLSLTCSLRQSPEAPVTTNRSNDYDNIRESFSQEWRIYDYENDKTWGWTVDERKKVFLGDVNLEPASLSGKRLLDAGCGNGTLTAALSAFGMEIVGIDLNEGLGTAYSNRGRYSNNAVEHVQYVQGNLVTPPFKEGLFDLVYSSGVIHHTPSSRDTFASLVRMTKKGGRLYVWVYGKRGWPVRLFFWLGRNSKRWLSLQSLMTLCRMLAPVYRVGGVILKVVGIMKFRPRTNEEITLDLFDAFAPRYNHYHTESEVRSWFEDNGFTNIHVSGIQKHGFGMYGDKV